MGPRHTGISGSRGAGICGILLVELAASRTRSGGNTSRSQVSLRPRGGCLVCLGLTSQGMPYAAVACRNHMNVVGQCPRTKVRHGSRSSRVVEDGGASVDQANGRRGRVGGSGGDAGRVRETEARRGGDSEIDGRGGEGSGGPGGDGAEGPMGGVAGGGGSAGGGVVGERALLLDRVAQARAVEGWRQGVRGGTREGAGVCAAGQGGAGPGEGLRAGEARRGGSGEDDRGGAGVSGGAGEVVGGRGGEREWEGWPEEGHTALVQHESLALAHRLRCPD